MHKQGSPMYKQAGSMDGAANLALPPTAAWGQRGAKRGDMHGAQTCGDGCGRERTHAHAHT
jgi:hypothetical protein